MFCCGVKPGNGFQARALAAIKELESQKRIMQSHTDRFEAFSNELKRQALAESRNGNTFLARLKVTEWKRNQANAELYHKYCTRIDARIAKVQKLMAIDDELKSGEASIQKLQALGVAVNEPEELSGRDNNDSDSTDGEGGATRRLRAPLSQTERFDLVRKNLEEFSSTVNNVEKNGDILDLEEEKTEDNEMDLLLQWERGIVIKKDDLSPKEVLMSVDSDGGG